MSTNQSSSVKHHKERVKARQQRRLEIKPTTGSASANKDTAQNSAPVTGVTRSAKDHKLRADILTSKRQADRNERKSRSGKGRGLPKKGGAGGKGTWGKPGTIDDLADSSSFDRNDPNYDSESEDKNIKIVGVDVLLSEEEATSVIKNILIEFLEHADTDDVADSACELNISGDMFYLFAKEALLLGLDTKDDSNRELVSVLLSDLYGYSVLIAPDIEKSFDVVLNDLEDIVLDCPEAASLLGKFMARCVADDCLAPKFIESRVNSGSFSTKAQEAITVAHGLIKMRHGLIVLDGIWNSGDYRKPVKYLVRKIKSMLKEYQNSLDYNNFVQSLHELGIPHFHHEIVYELIVKCLEENSICSAQAQQDETVRGIASHDNRNIETYFNLLTQLTKSNEVAMTQFENGVKRVYEEIVDLAIDIPGAFQSLEALCVRCESEICILDSALHSQLKQSAETVLKEADLAVLIKESHGHPIAS